VKTSIWVGFILLFAAICACAAIVAYIAATIYLRLKLFLARKEYKEVKRKIKLVKEWEIKKGLYDTATTED
jgi:hypothetical protein